LKIERLSSHLCRHKAHVFVTYSDTVDHYIVLEWFHVTLGFVGFLCTTSVGVERPSVVDPLALPRGGSDGPVCPYIGYAQPHILCGGP